MRHTKKTLKNGMRVVAVPMKDTKSLTLLVLFSAGSRFETRRTSGVAHFLEHLFFKGTKSRPRPGQISRALDDLGAEHNAFTAKEYTGYWVKAASRHFPAALDIVSDILLEPLFKAEEIEKERGVIFQEMSMYRDTPRRYVHDIFETLIFGDQPMGWEIIGTPQSLRALARADIAGYRSARYGGSNAVAVLAGNFSGNAVENLSSAFSALPVGKQGKKPLLQKLNARSAVRLEFKKTDQTHMVMGVPAYGMFDDRRFAENLLATIVGGKSSSRLFEEIREKRGLAYTVSAFSEQFTDSGYFSVYAGVPHRKAKEVVRRIRAAFQAIARKGVLARELRSAKDFWRGQFAISLESSDEIASFFGSRELFYKHIISPEEVMARIEKVSAEEIQKIAHDIFKDNALRLAIIGPHRDSLEYSELLGV